jgi:hypothetical protein
MKTSRDRRYTKTGFMNYEKAKEFIRQFRIEDSRDFRRWALYQRPKNFPSNPPRHYHGEWEGWKIFLGYETETE